MLNGPAACSIHAYIHTHRSSCCLKVSFIYWWCKMNQISLHYSHISHFELFVYIYTRRCVVSKTIPTIIMKPTDQNGLSLSLSSLLTPIVPLLSLSLSLFLPLLHPLFSIIGCMHNLSTPLRLRINEWCEKKMDKKIKTDIIWYLSSIFYLLTLLMIIYISKKKNKTKQWISDIQTINFIFPCPLFFFFVRSSS